MNNLIPVEYQNQRILTTAQLAENYETTSTVISNNFNNNKERYQEGKHYFALEGELLKEFLQSSNLGLQNESKIRSFYLWTEKGCLRHAKSLGTDKAWEVFEMLEETYFNKQQTFKQMSQAEILAGLAQVTVEIERKANTAIEVANRASKQITNALDIFTAPIDKDWRQAMNAKMRGICQEYELSYLTFYHDLYEELENLARVDLKARLARLRTRLQAQGATKTACKAITKLEVIERDPKLKPIFEGIVRKYQAKYAVTQENRVITNVN